MGRTLPGTDSTVVSAFHSSLAHDAIILSLALIALLLVWNVALGDRLLHSVRASRGGAVGDSSTGAATPALASREPGGRLVLRIGFGLLWVLDGVLQLQSAMPLGLPGSVLQPAASGSPSWVQHLVNFGVTTWTNHPVEAAVATVWIQLGIGVFLIVAPRGRLSRLAGAVSAGWGVAVWIFGEAFGGIFGSGVSWLFGAPGAVLIYCVAGVLLALPERAWRGRLIGRSVLGGAGAFFVGMAVLQAWPGRGFWQGAVGGRPGSGALSAMVAQMATTSQPRLLSSWLSSFEAFDSAHGWGVNLFVVAALAACGALLLAGAWTQRPRLALAGVATSAVLCLATWVLVQDFGFLGGVGTDPNSMIPTVLLLVGGYLALAMPDSAPSTATATATAMAHPAPDQVPTPGTATEPVPTPAPVPAERRPGGWRERWTPLYMAGVFASLVALVAIVLGAAPMALATTNPNADPIIAEALDGTPNYVDVPAPAFSLVNQRGTEVSLASLRGRTVVLTFFDPVCTSDCPLIAQELREADSLLGTRSGKVELVAVVANPVDRALAYVNAFDRQEDLDHLGNWLFLTGSVADLAGVWQSYGVQVAVSGAGAMVAHSDLVYIIDSHGDTREVISSDPGQGATAQSSFAVYLSEQLSTVISQ